MSVETTQTSPSRSPCQSRSWSPRRLDLRAAGEEVAVGPVEDRVVEHEVLGAGLGVDVHAPGLGGLDDVGPLGGRHVDDVEPAAGGLGPGDGPLDRLGLDEVGAGDRVELRAVPGHQLGRVVAGDQLVEHAARLGVDQEHRPEVLAPLQGVEDGPVVGLPALGGVDHELLERRAALRDHRRHLGAVAVPVGDGQVEGVVDARLGPGLGRPVGEGVGERLRRRKGWRSR